MSGYEIKNEVFNRLKLTNDPRNAFSDVELREARENIVWRVRQDLDDLERLIKDYFVVAPSDEFAHAEVLLLGSTREVVPETEEETVKIIVRHPLIAKLLDEDCHSYFGPSHTEQ
jgi:hypothetical protein